MLEIKLKKMVDKLFKLTDPELIQHLKDNYYIRDYGSVAGTFIKITKHRVI